MENETQEQQTATDADEAAAPAEPETAEELESELKALMEKVIRQRKLVAMSAHKLRGTAHFCEPGLSDFFSDMGIPFDRYAPSKLAHLKAWDGVLISSYHGRYNWGEDDILFSNLDPSLYSVKGMRIVITRIRNAHELWIKEVKDRAVRESNAGRFGPQALNGALTRAEIAPPQPVTRIDMTAVASWTTAMPRKEFSDRKFIAGLTRVIGEYLNENSGPDTNFTHTTDVRISAAETFR